MSHRIVALGLLAAGGLVAALVAAEPGKTGTPQGFRQHDASRPRPPVVEPAAIPAEFPAPKDAVVLIDGKSLDAWQGADGGKAGWKVEDGYVEVTPGAGAIRTKAEFGDVQLHVEWASPEPAKGTGQDRGNTGLFLMGKYEVQILDSYRADTYADGQAGAIYGQYPPIVNASRPPGEWQSYDLAFRRPRFDEAGKLVQPAHLTLFHNGILVQNNEEILGETSWLHWTPYEAHGDAGPIELQDHGHPVRFRNLWVRNLPARPAPDAEALKRPEIVAMSEADLDRFAGLYAMGGGTGTQVKIARTGAHLTIKFPFLPKALAIEPTSDREFILPDTDGKLTFRRDAEGRVGGALFKIGDGERVLRRLAE